MEQTLKGRIWLITDNKNERIDDIDTDMIFHNKYLHITDISKMGQYSFDNLKGWEDFATKAKKNDMIVVGENFGSGSSRQQAVDCFISNGITAIIGESFGAIYKRNAINTGLPLVEAPGIFHSDLFKSGDEVELNLMDGTIKNITNGNIFKAAPMSKVAHEIYLAGGLFNL